MLSPRPRLLAATVAGLLGVTAVVSGAIPASAAAPSPKRADAALDRAIQAFTTAPDGPPAIAVVVQRGRRAVLHAAGTSQVGTQTAPTLADHTRVASVAKAFSGATALSAVASGDLKLTSTIGKVRPDLPKAWAKVQLWQLLQHSSGIPDFSQTDAFAEAFRASLLTPPPPVDLLSFVADQPLSFRPGSKYKYSNSDNIIIGLMVENATKDTYEKALEQRVYQRLDLDETSLPSNQVMPTPFIHGYQPDPPGPLEDVSEAFAAGWTWASGGIVSTPADANRFVRGYVAGKTTSPAAHKAQMRFRPGHSEPPGPGRNSAGLAVFRYRTRCGTVYGHTGNTAGYTQFIAATRDGKRSVSVSVSAQVTPDSRPAEFPALRRIFGLAVCAALAK
jgi:D-alanyl-D-alanine carboxypeptidase